VVEILEILNQLAQPVLAFFTIGLVVATILLWRSTKRYAKATENLLAVTKGYADSTEQMSKTMESQKDISARQTTIMEDQTKIMANQAKISDEEARDRRILRLRKMVSDAEETLRKELEKSNNKVNEHTLIIELALFGLLKRIESEEELVGKEIAENLITSMTPEDRKEKDRKELFDKLLSKGYTEEDINKFAEIFSDLVDEHSPNTILSNYDAILSKVKHRLNLK